MPSIDSSEALRPYVETLRPGSSAPAQHKQTPADKASIPLWMRCADQQQEQVEDLSAEEIMLVKRSTTYLEFQRDIQSRFLSLYDHDPSLCFEWKTRLYPAGPALPLTVRGMTWPFVRTKILDGQPAGKGPRSYLQVDFSRIPENDVAAALSRGSAEHGEQSLLLLGMVQRRDFSLGAVKDTEQWRLQQPSPPSVPSYHQRHATERGPVTATHSSASCSCGDCTDSLHRSDARAEQNQAHQHMAWIADQSILIVNREPRRTDEVCPKHVRNIIKLNSSEESAPLPSIRRDSLFAAPDSDIGAWDAHQRYKCRKGCGYCKEAKALGMQMSGMRCCMQ